MRILIFATPYWRIASIHVFRTICLVSILPLIQCGTINSALLPHYLDLFASDTFSAAYVGKRFYNFFYCPRISGRVFLSLTLFLAFCIEDLKLLYITFMQSCPRCTGNIPLGKTFLQKKAISLR